jgi:triacylglycerol lipase
MSFLVELPQNEFNADAFKQFAPDAGCSKGNALAMAWISQLAYETRLPDKVRAIGELWDLADVRIVQQPARSTLPLSDTWPARAVLSSSRSREPIRSICSTG